MLCSADMVHSDILCNPSLYLLLGGVAQWLGRRSLAGGLSLTYALSVVDMWPLCASTVWYGWTNQANWAFHPFGVGKWVVIHAWGDH